MTTYSATYSPEDNKLRLYAAARLDAETYARAKALGFKWAPVQKLFVAPAWSPAREDFLIELAGEIEPEGVTLAERAAEKAARMDTLAEKRRRDANAYSRAADAISERFAGGQPILMGHHSQRRAEKDRDRMEGATRKAVKAAGLVNYWLYRAEGVEAHANYKSAPGVRARRIKTLLTDLRGLQGSLNNAARRAAYWREIRATNPTTEQVARLAGNCERDLGASYELCRAVDTGKITGAEFMEKAISGAESVISGPTLARWIEHTLNRLAFERAELGPVARYDGALSAVILQAFARTHGAESPKAEKTDFGWLVRSPVPLPHHLSAGPELELDADDWRDLMQSAGYEVPAKKDAARGKSDLAPIINLTEADGARIQALWNARAVAAGVRGGGYQPEKRKSPLVRMTQAQYSARAAGTYGPCKTLDIGADGLEVRPPLHSKWADCKAFRVANTVARLRVFTGGREMYGAKSLVIISDKPGKAAPFDWTRVDALTDEANAATPRAQGAAA
mgnify:CR=1 FL=1